MPPTRPGSGSHPGFPDRPLLRPGVRVCRRSATELQVGLERGLAVVAPDTAAVRDLLEGLRRAVPPPAPAGLTPELARFCLDLLDHELVVDADALLPALARAEDSLGRRTTAATFAEHARDAAAVLARRATASVHVEAGRLPESGRRCEQLLRAAGVGQEQATAVLHLTDTEPDRGLVDDWARADLPHLVVTAVEGIVRVGPFVVPGVTACLRCLDAHQAEHDPRRGLVVQQYAGEPMREDPLPADLWQLATAFAVRELVRWVDGHRPRTWSATVRVDAALELTPTTWTRHPGCGCSWGLTRAG